MVVAPDRGRLGAPPSRGISAKDLAPFGWAPLVVLFVVGLVDRIEASLISGVLPLIQEEFAIGDTAAGAIPSAAALAAALVALPAGWLADRYSRTGVIAVVVFCWGLATLGSGLAATFSIFFLMRVLLAAAENIDNPASGSLLADYYPPVNRAKAYGIVRITTYLGGIGTALAGVLGQALGWRMTFMVMAIPGVLTALLVWWLKEPPRGFLDQVIARGGGEPVPVPAATARRTGEKLSDRVTARLRFAGQFGELMRVPTVTLVSVGLGLLTLGLAGIHYWLPSLIFREFKVPLAQASSTAGLLSVAGVVTGTLIGAWLAKRVHGVLKGGQLLVGGVGITAGSLVQGAAFLMGSYGPFLALCVLAWTLSSVAIPTMTASIADVARADSRGLAFAIVQLFITAGAAFGPLVVGFSSDQAGSLLTAMYILIAPMVTGGLLCLLARGFFGRDAQRVLDAAREAAIR
ncbi:MFS transporter [Thermoactinospora rubra]|uniref:MFS transporter n=1 Tax=Thermoactinospora rubra TaxID=1088767 RepID=UPI000A1203DD|nr:MFS transporter [Thermoactinospora rubra]